MSASLSEKITDAIRTGAAPLITIAELVEQAQQDGVVEVSFADDPLGLSSLYRIAALTPGVPIGQWLPNDGAIAPIFGGVVQIESVTFTLNLDDDTLVSIETVVSFAPDDGGVSLSVLQTPAVASTVTRLSFTVGSPLAPPRTVDSQIDGELTLGALVLAVVVTTPELVFSATKRPDDPPLAFPDLLGGFGLPLASRFAGLQLDELTLDIQSRQSSAYCKVALSTGDGAPFSLLDGVLALQSASVEIQHAPDGTAATVAGDVVVKDRIFLSAEIATDTSAGTWDLAGSLDVPASVAALGKPEGSPLTVADLVTTVFGFPLPSRMQSFLGTVGLEALAGTANIAADATTYTLDTTFVVDWDLADGVSLSARTGISIEDGATTITGDFDIGGFELSMSYTATEEASNTLHATAPQLAGLEVTYELGEGVLTLGWGDSAPSTSLGDLIADFIGLVTGNPFVTLPPPWDVLGDVDLSLQAVSVEVNLQTKAIAIRYERTLLDLFGVSIDGFELAFDSTKPRGQRLKFTMMGDLTILIGDEEPSFDPEQPSTAPAIPGQGAAVFAIPLVAVGQHVALPPEDSTSVETAVSGIKTIAGAGVDDPANLPTFSKDAGWLIGAHLRFLGAIDVQMVFADPSIYGVLVQVERPTPPAKASPAVEALVGLRAEILYRRISDSIGVYEGHLTLPDSIRKVDFGAFQLQLPSLSVAIYTNGDFLVDVGFPHGGDFSNSLIVNAGQYTGAGGVYYGRLSGETASALPPVPTDSGGSALGAFGSTTAIGIGVRVGIEKGYSSGPLTASFSVVLQAIFEGLFSTYTQFSDRATEDYFDIRASISIIGQLQGELDFKIITASVLVRIEVTVAVRAIAARAVTVPVTARVTVKVSVKIDLGLFSVRIHFSFDATVGFTATFGHDRHALWDGPGGRHSLPDRAAATLDFRTLPVGLTLPLFVVPQLTRGERSGTPSWLYTVQLALPTTAAGEAAATDEARFVDFAKLVTAWVIDADQRATGTPTTVDELYAAISVTPEDLSAIMDALQQAKASADARPTLDDIQALMAGNQFDLEFPSGRGSEVGLGFFPLVPGCSVSFTEGSGSATAVAGSSAQQGDLLRDYVLMIALKIIDDAQGLDLAPEQSVTLASIFDQLGATKLDEATALVSRFMLHGTRVSDGAGGLEALYDATGQQVVLSDLAATSLTITLSNDAPSSWGFVFPQPADAGDDPPPATSITLTSASGQLYVPTAIAAFPTAVTETGIVAGEMSNVVTMMRQFALLPGAPGATATLRRLPRQLVALAAGGSVSGMRLFDASDAALTGGYEWATTVPFDVRRIPDSSGNAPYLEDTYAVVGVQSDGLDALEALYREQTDPGGGPAITRLEVAWVTEDASGARTLHQVEASASTAFLFQSNISTGVAPGDTDAPGQGAPSISANLDFLGRLLGSGLGTTGGFYLYLGVDGGLPAELFDSRGLGRLMAVVSFTTNVAGDALRPYFTAARLSDPEQADDDISAGAAAVTTQYSSVPPGTVGAQVSRPEPPEDGTGYQDSLDHLFDLIVFAPEQLLDASNQGTAVTMALPPSVGPLDTADAAAGTLVYRHVYDLLTLTGHDCGADSMDDACSPYQFVGQRLQLGFSWIDLFGDVLPAGFSADPVTITFVDPLTNLGDWPGLVFGFEVEGGGGSPRRLLLKSTWVPQSEDAAQPLSDEARAQFAKIFHQLAACDVTASISITDAVLSPVSGDPDPRDVLRQNIRTIVDEADDATAPVALTDVRFELPADDASYHDDLLQELTAAISFARQGTADPDFDDATRATILGSRSALVPYHPVVTEGEGEEATSIISYRAFARGFETAFASMQLKVMAGSLDAAQGGQFYAIRWGDQGVALGLSAATGTGDRGFAPPPFATSLQSRDEIQPLVNQSIPDGNTFTLPEAPLSVTNLDVDAAMSSFVSAVERFLAPDLGVAAARLDRASVDRCVAAKQQLSGQLSARVVPLGTEGQDDAEALASARETYRQACLVALTSYYSVDAVGVLEVSTQVPAGRTLPDLAVHGQPVQDTASDVSVSPGRARLRTGSAQPLALSLSSRNKGWQATYAVPQAFAIEALELVTGSVSIATTDEPVVDGVRQQRSYRTGEWLRFVLDENTRQPVQAPPVALPLRVYPSAPLLRSQGSSPAPIDDQSPTSPIEEAKSWSLDAAYRHTYAAQDTMHLTVVLNEKPASRMGAGEAEQDLLDALVQFTALYPSLQVAFDALLSGEGDEQQSRDAIVAFVALVEYVHDHFAFDPEERDVGAAPTGVGDTWRFAIQERFSGDPTTEPFEAVERLELSPPDLSFELPSPVLTIAGYEGYLHQEVDGARVYRFRNAQGQDLPAMEGIGTPERSLAVQPLDVIDWQNGRVYLQVVRNEGLPTDFVYTTPVVGARDYVVPFVQRTVDIDIATFSRPDYGGEAPPEGSLLDWTARLFYVLLHGRADEDFARRGSVRTSVSLTWPVAPGSEGFALPSVRLPITLTLPESIAFDPTPDQAVELVRPLVSAVEAWLTAQGIGPGSELHGVAELDYEVTVFSEVSETGLPILRLDGLTLRLDSIAG